MFPGQRALEVAPAAASAAPLARLRFRSAASGAGRRASLERAHGWFGGSRQHAVLARTATTAAAICAMPRQLATRKANFRGAGTSRFLAQPVPVGGARGFLSRAESKATTRSFPPRRAADRRCRFWACAFAEAVFRACVTTRQSRSAVLVPDRRDPGTGRAAAGAVRKGTQKTMFALPHGPGSPRRGCFGTGSDLRARRDAVFIDGDIDPLRQAWLGALYASKRSPARDGPPPGYGV